VSSQCGKLSDYDLLGYVRRQVLPFEWNILPPTSGSTMKVKGARSSKTLIPIHKTPCHHILTAYSLVSVWFMKIIRVPISATIQEFSCIMEPTTQQLLDELPLSNK